MKELTASNAGGGGDSGAVDCHGDVVLVTMVGDGDDVSVPVVMNSHGDGRKQNCSTVLAADSNRSFRRQILKIVKFVRKNYVVRQDCPSPRSKVPSSSCDGLLEKADRIFGSARLTVAFAPYLY
jgi:hypothetical protein